MTEVFQKYEVIHLTTPLSGRSGAGHCWYAEAKQNMSTPNLTPSLDQQFGAKWHTQTHI